MERGRDELKGRDEVRALAPRQRQHLGERCAGGELHPGRGALHRLRPELQHHAGDDAERALRADEVLLEVVAGVVLAQALHVVEDLAVGQHHLQPEHEVARHAVAQHGQPAGVGADVAAEPAAALRAEAERQHEPALPRRLLRIRQHHAGVGRERVAKRVDLANPVHPLQADDEMAAGEVGRCAAAIAGVAGLRHEGEAEPRGELHDALHLRRVGRPQHRGRRAAQEVAVVDYVAFHQVRPGKDARFAERRPEIVHHVAGHGSSLPFALFNTHAAC